MLYRPPGSAGLMHFRTHRAHGCATKGPDLECKDVPQYVVVSCMFIYFHVISYLYTCHVEIVNQVRSYWLTFQSYKYSTRGVLNKRRGLEQLRISDLDGISDNVWNILESSEKLMEGQLLVRDAFVDAKGTRSRVCGVAMVDASD